MLYKGIFSLFFLMLICSISKANDTLINFAKSTTEPGSIWRFLDNNTDLIGTVPTWRDTTYDDASWKSGPSELGYGDNDQNTCVAWNATNPNPTTCTSTSGAKFTTTYFRKVFYITDPTAYSSFILQYKRDDGLQIYINGVRYVISNLTDPVAHATFASLAGDNGETVFTTTIPTSAFYGNGRRNVIAVDLHQTTLNSSDITFDLQLIGVNEPSLIRGPYLQKGNQTAVTLRWRTDLPSNSRVTWGTAFGSYPNTIDSSTLKTEHTVVISGLTADTKYYYTIGNTATIFQADANNYFLTLPVNNSTRKVKIIAFGDCGNASTNQTNTKNAFLNYAGTNDIDAWILLGDNAYNNGLDAELQGSFFDIYKNDMLRNLKLYPAPGNHDYGQSNANAGNRNNAYYQSFEMPTAAECGGVPSGTESYYSFDIGNVHFLSLDSYGRENGNTTKIYDTTGDQANWVKADLAANTKRWTIAFFHHPPYTMTSHNSDTELGDLGRMREEFIRILERNGVDMILCGHSHGYERSYLLKNYYKQNPGDPTLLEANFNIATHTATSSDQNAMYNGTTNSCPYTYNSGSYNHGTVYVVSGSAGRIGGGQTEYPHNAMYYSNNTNGGSFYIEADSNRLDAKFISYTGTGATVAPLVRDQFTIFKDINKRQTINVLRNSTITLAASWRGGYYWPNNGGAITQSVEILNATPGTFQYIVRDSATNVCIADTFDIVVSTATVPVTLKNFTAKLVTNKVFLNWITAQELNNKYFTLEKSTNGINYKELTKVNGANNNTQNNKYQFVDKNLEVGLNYYRLSQTDIGGTKQYFEVKKIEYKPKYNFDISVINTASGKVNLQISSTENDNLSIKIIDMLGRVVKQNTVAVASGKKQLEYMLKSGNYVFDIANSKGQKSNTKLSVQ